MQLKYKLDSSFEIKLDHFHNIIKFKQNPEEKSLTDQCIQFSDVKGIHINDLFNIFFTKTKFTTLFLDKLHDFLNNGNIGTLLISSLITTNHYQNIFGTFIYRLTIIKNSKEIKLIMDNELRRIKITSEVYNFKYHEYMVNMFNNEKRRDNVKVENIAFIAEKLTHLCNYNVAHFHKNNKTIAEIINALKINPISSKALFCNTKCGSVYSEQMKLIKKYPDELLNEFNGLYCIPTMQLDSNEIYTYC